MFPTPLSHSPNPPRDSSADSRAIVLPKPLPKPSPKPLLSDLAASHVQPYAKLSLKVPRRVEEMHSNSTGGLPRAAAENRMVVGKIGERQEGLNSGKQALKGNGTDEEEGSEEWTEDEAEDEVEDGEIRECIGGVLGSAQSVGDQMVDELEEMDDQEEEQASRRAIVSRFIDDEAQVSRWDFNSYLCVIFADLTSGSRCEPKTRTMKPM